MKKIFRYIPIAVALVAFASCSSDDANDNVVNSKELNVFASIEGGVANVSSAANETRALGTSWDANDEIGITGNGYSNVKYVTASGNGTFAHALGGPIYYSNNNNNVADYWAYYPFVGTPGTTPTALEVVPLLTSNQTPAKQKEYDVLVARASNSVGSNVVRFNFRHKMASLTFVFVRSTNLAANYPDLTGLRFTLNNFYLNGTFSPRDTTITVRTDLGIGTLDYTMSAVDGENNAATQCTKQLILLPQAAFTTSMSVTLTDPDYSGKTFTGTLNVPQLEAGKNYTVTVTVDMPSLTFSTSSITSWGGSTSIGSVNASV